MNDKDFLKRINELSIKALKENRAVFTGFLTLSEQSQILCLVSKLSTKVLFDGGFPMAERKLACFNPFNQEESDLRINFPIAILKITHSDRGYTRKLSHRDYLGALINLGIERKIIGDILLEGDLAWVFCLKHMSDFICESLLKVGNTYVSVQLCENLPEELLLKEPDEIGIYVPSLRLDACISKVYKMSRGQALKYLQADKVFVNSILKKHPAYMIKNGDIITVRGFGRFKYKGVSYKTKKGNLKITVAVY